MAILLSDALSSSLEPTKVQKQSCFHEWHPICQHSVVGLLRRRPSFQDRPGKFPNVTHASSDRFGHRRATSGTEAIHVSPLDMIDRDTHTTSPDWFK
jgi:hypothetical protein